MGAWASRLLKIMDNIINQRVIVNLPETIGRYTAGKKQHVLAGKIIRDLINSLKQTFPSSIEFLDNCEAIRDGKRLLFDNEVYDGDEIYLRKRKK